MSYLLLFLLPSLSILSRSSPQKNYIYQAAHIISRQKTTYREENVKATKRESSLATVISKSPLISTVDKIKK